MTHHIYNTRLKSGVIHSNTTLLLMKQISVSLKCTVKPQFNIPAVCVFCNFTQFLYVLNSVFSGFYAIIGGLHKNMNCSCPNL